MSLFFRFKKYAEYQWKAKTKYYLHSPFVYQFYLNVLRNKRFETLSPLVSYRQQLRKDYRQVSITDFGTGTAQKRTLYSIEQNVAVNHKYGQLLFSIVQYYKPKHILEIGTSVGISSSYISLANKNYKTISLEGSPELIALAKQTHLMLGLKNIEVIEGEFSKIIPQALNKFDSLDMVYFDGNHTKEATLKYFELCLANAHEHSIFVFDDVYWNKEMSKAWEEIKQHHAVTLTIDVYQFGICFFRKEKLAKENFVLRY